MISKQQAQAMYEHYDTMVSKLTAAMVALGEGGVKRYSIDDRSLTKLDLDKLSLEIEAAVRKRAEYDALRRGRRPRKAFGVVPRNW